MSSSRGRGRGPYNLPMHLVQSRGGGSNGVPRGAGSYRGRGSGGDSIFRQAQAISISHTHLTNHVPFYRQNEPPRPNQNIQKVEDAFSTVLTSNTNPAPHPPTRPGYSTKGEEVTLWTNFIQLSFSNNRLNLYRYAIDISPGPTGTSPKGKKLHRVVQLLLEQHFPQNNIATDFRALLISSEDLKIQAEPYTVRYSVEGQNVNNPALVPITYCVRLLRIGTLKISDLHTYLSSVQTRATTAKEAIIQALNIVVGHHPRSTASVTSVGSGKHFDIHHGDWTNLGECLRAFRGFFVSVRPATARLLLNVQVKHAAFYRTGSLNDLMISFLGENENNKAKLEKFLKKLSIHAKYASQSDQSTQMISKPKQIFGFAATTDGFGLPQRPIVRARGAGPNDVQFFHQTYGYITVTKYFLQQHQISLRHTNLPVINVGDAKNPVYLPPEICQVRPGQPFHGALSPSQTQSMISFAVRKPVLNGKSIVNEGVALVGCAPINPTLGAFGISTSGRLIAVPGRVLNTPTVEYDQNRIVDVKFGSWNLRGVKFVKKSSLSRWTYLWISLPGARDPWRNESELKSKLDQFAQAMRSVGIDTNYSMRGLHRTIDPRNIEKDIDTAVNAFKTNNPPRLILVLLPSECAPYYNRAIYNSVKVSCDITYGLLNVCVTAPLFAKGNLQVYANLALKVNTKLGGQNQKVRPDQLGLIKENETMLVGLDVTHPSPSSTEAAPSVAGIVASVDGNLGQWPGELKFLPSKQEMITGLESMFTNRIALWRAQNGNLPKNILIFRDGVSEGQYSLVLDEELPAMRQACRKIYPATATNEGFPRLSIVIVGKRHNTRFYPTSAANADRSMNPQNGTVVDRGVTEARNWDFFLQAHTALQGTARPAHYYVIFDEIFRKRSPLPFRNPAEALEDLVHNLCYLHSRATKAVSICPAAYYADLLCERARCYLSDVFDSTSMSDSGVSGAGPILDSTRIRLHENVRDAMFYI